MYMYFSEDHYWKVFENDSVHVLLNSISNIQQNTTIYVKYFILIEGIEVT